MKYLLILTMIILTGCGEFKEPKQPVLSNGAYYFFNSNDNMLAGQLGITIDYQKKLDVEQIEEFRSLNSNNEYAMHPTISFPNTTWNNNKAYYGTDVTYSSNSNIKNSLNQKIKSGKHYTTYYLTIENYLIRLTIIIYEKELSKGLGNVFTKRDFYAIP